MPDVFTGEFFQKFNEEWLLILHNLFQKIEKEGILSNSFYVVCTNLIPKLGTDITRLKNKQTTD